MIRFRSTSTLMQLLHEHVHITQLRFSPMKVGTVPERIEEALPGHWEMA